MKKVQINVETSRLVHCDWNPRTESELLPDHPEMQKLIASVRELGVLQPIAVWDRASPSAPLLVIAGNRRFAAARALALPEIPAVVFSGISFAQAHEITRVENEVRLGVDPVKDASLIGSMLALGYSQKEIAAHFGVSEPTVCRRAKLLNLAPEIREIASSAAISTYALERISLYPTDVQRACASAVRKAAARAIKDDSTLRWSQLEWDFNSNTRDLSSAKFDTSDCASCTNRTGAQPDLWGDVSDDSLGRCLNCSCFADHHAAFVRSLVVAKVGPDVELVHVDDAPLSRHELTSDAWRKFFGKTRTKSRPVAYWDYANYSGELSVIWGAPLADVEAEIERRAAANAAASAAAESVRAERLRLAYFRHPLLEARDDLYAIPADNWFSSDCPALLRREISNLLTPVQSPAKTPVKSVGVLSDETKVQSVGVLADALQAGLDDYAFRSDHPDWAVLLAKAFPPIAKALKLKPAFFADVAAAEKALADFDAENPLP